MEKSKIELKREELVKVLKSFNENENNDFISKEEETLILSYLLNSNTCLARSAKHRGLTTYDIGVNILCDFDLFN